MACRSFEGAALTVSLSEFLPPGGGVRDNVAEGGWLEGLPLRRVLVRVYGFADSRAAEVGAARAERRFAGMARAVVECDAVWYAGGAVVVVVEVEGKEGRLP